MERQEVAYFVLAGAFIAFGCSRERELPVWVRLLSLAVWVACLSWFTSMLRYGGV